MQNLKSFTFFSFSFFFGGGGGGGGCSGYLTSAFLVEALFSSDKQIIHELTKDKMEVKLSDFVHFIVCVCCLKKVLALKICTVLYCLIKINIIYPFVCFDIVSECIFVLDFVFPLH